MHFVFRFKVDARSSAHRGVVSVESLDADKHSAKLDGKQPADKDTKQLHTDIPEPEPGFPTNFPAERTSKPDSIPQKAPSLVKSHESIPKLVQVLPADDRRE